MLVKCCLTPPRRLARCRDPAQGAEEEGRYQQRQQLVQKLVRCLAARESAGFGVVEGEGARKQSGLESPRASTWSRGRQVFSRGITRMDLSFRESSWNGCGREMGGLSVDMENSGQVVSVEFLVGGRDV